MTSESSSWTAALTGDDGARNDESTHSDASVTDDDESPLRYKRAHVTSRYLDSPLGCSDPRV